MCAKYYSGILLEQMLHPKNVAKNRTINHINFYLIFRNVHYLFIYILTFLFVQISMTQSYGTYNSYTGSYMLDNSSCRIYIVVWMCEYVCIWLDNGVDCLSRRRAASANRKELSTHVWLMRVGMLPQTVRGISDRYRCTVYYAIYQKWFDIKISGRIPYGVVRYWFINDNRAFLHSSCWLFLW